MSKFKAQVTEIKLGSVTVMGLLLEDSTFGLSVPQLNDLLQFSSIQNTASRDLKRLLPKGSSPSIELVSVEGVNQKINVIRLGDFERVLFELAMKGNKAAINLNRDLVGLSLVQLFSDAFEIEFDKQDRANWLTERQIARELFQPEFAIHLKRFSESHNVSLNYGKQVNMFKEAIRLPLEPIDTYTADELKKWHKSITRFDAYLDSGLTLLESYCKLAERELMAD